MLNINLGDNHYTAISPSEHLRVDFNDMLLPCAIYNYKRPIDNNSGVIDKSRKYIPPIEDTYNALKADTGWDDDTILAYLIEVYMPVRYFQNREFAKIVKTIGFVGKRGSGKSASAANLLVMDWLIHDKPVFSNMDIAVRVVYKDLEKEFRSRRLDTLEILSLDVGNVEGGVVFIDEINMSAAESSRHMSGANLEFSYAMQQIRKLGLSVVWTAQGWEWVDNRVRWQTDFCVMCRDCFQDKSYHATCYGDKSMWRVCDISGLTGKVPDSDGRESQWIINYLVWTGAIWNKPIWAAYDTKETQTGGYIEAFKAAKAQEKYVKQFQVGEAKDAPAKELVESLIASEIEAFYADSFWLKNGVTRLGDKQRIGRQLKPYFNRRLTTDGYFYERKNKQNEGLD